MMTTSNEIRATLLIRAQCAANWFLTALTDTDQRSMDEVDAAKAAVLKFVQGQAYSSYGDNPARLWLALDENLPRWIDDPASLQASLGLSGGTPWTAQGLVLVAGLLLAEGAADGFFEQRRSAELRAAWLLADTSEAQIVWSGLRDIDRRTMEAGQAAKEKTEFMRERSRAAGISSGQARSSRKGGKLEKQAAMRAAWATGKYKSKADCAERMHGTLGVAITTAKKYLDGAPLAP